MIASRRAIATACVRVSASSLARMWRTWLFTVSWLMKSFVDPALMPAFLTGKEQNEMLTSREREILQLLADGMSNADVAARLFISQETVKSHVRHILAKLEADTRTHAVAIALRDAIID